MENPKKSLQDKPKQRHITVTVPYSVMFALVICLGYAILFFTKSEPVLLVKFKPFAFSLFLLCTFSFLALYALAARHINSFLVAHPVIQSETDIEALESVCRANSYSTLLIWLFIALGTFTASVTVFNGPLWNAVMVGVLCALAVAVVRWYSRFEEKLKQISCQHYELEPKLKSVLERWQKKILPGF